MTPQPTRSAPLTAPQAFRALRRPLVALGVLLLFANLWLPATGLAFAPGIGLLCHGILPAVTQEDGDAPVRLSQPCCMAAALALLPEPPALPAVRAATFAADPQRPLVALTHHLPPRAYPIRAPPIS